MPRGNFNVDLLRNLNSIKRRVRIIEAKEPPATNFISGTDTPSVYTGEANKFLSVKSTEDQLIFSSVIFNNEVDKLIHIIDTGSIGTPALGADAQLVVQNSGSAGDNANLSIIAGNTGNSVLNFGDTDDENVGFLDYDNNADSLSIGTNTATQVFVNSSGDVGIGTTSPSRKLHVAMDGGSVPSISANTGLIVSNTSAAGDAAVISIISGNTGSSSIYFGDTDSELPGYIFYNHNTNQMTFSVNGANRLSINSSGNVGINDTTPSYKLDVNGTLRAFGITDSSDSRLKKKTKRIKNVADKLSQLNAYEFVWKDNVPAKSNGRGKRIGLMAQEVEQQFPDLVDKVPYTDSDGNRYEDYMTVSMSGVVALLVETVKELNQRLLTLE
jgi:hypothetical protein